MKWNGREREREESFLYIYLLLNVYVNGMEGKQTTGKWIEDIYIYIYI